MLLRPYISENTIKIDLNILTDLREHIRISEYWSKSYLYIECKKPLLSLLSHYPTSISCFWVTTKYSRTNFTTIPLLASTNAWLVCLLLFFQLGCRKEADSASVNFRRENSKPSDRRFSEISIAFSRVKAGSLPSLRKHS